LKALSLRFRCKATAILLNWRREPAAERPRWPSGRS
jgi:hypothetical protein